MTVDRLGHGFITKHTVTINWFLNNRQQGVELLLKRKGQATRNTEILIRYVTTEQSLDDIATDYKLTRERVRQIVDQTLTFLRKETDNAEAQ